MTCKFTVNCHIKKPQVNIKTICVMTMKLEIICYSEALVCSILQNRKWYSQYEKSAEEKLWQQEYIVWRHDVLFTHTYIKFLIVNLSSFEALVWKQPWIESKETPTFIKTNRQRLLWNYGDDTNNQWFISDWVCILRRNVTIIS